MKYTVTIDADKRTVTVNYKGSIGVAKCCPTDTFDLTTGVELALERARVAYKNANTKATRPSVMELVHALEQALPKGEVVVVGNGEGLTSAHKRWLHSLTDCKGDYDAGYAVGYAAGYAKCVQEYGEIEDFLAEYDELIARIREMLDEATE